MFHGLHKHSGTNFLVCLIRNEMSHQQTLERYGDEKLHKHIECLVQSIVSIQSEHTKVDIIATQCCLEHVEAS